MGEGNMNKVSSFEALHRVLDFYMNCNMAEAHVRELVQDCDDTVNWYQYITADAAIEEEIFVCAKSSISNIVAQTQMHDKSCDKDLFIDSPKKLQHVLSLSLKCTQGHTFSWTASPHTEKGKFVANLKMAHGYFTSGMLPNQYHKFCNTSEIGNLNEKYLSELQKTYSLVVKQEHDKSIALAMQEEIAFTAASVDEPEDVLDGIGIITDARHCWRKNAKFSDVVCLGNCTHKVLRTETIGRDDDPCSQRHELAGIRRIYDYLDDNDCPVKIHAHDNNSSVIKFVREERSPTINANDTWHLTKSLAKQARKITTGPASTMGKTWHEKLSDKAAAIKTHVFHSMKNCDGNADELKANILNLISHYKGDHSNCFQTARCRTDPNYISTKFPITDPSAEIILKNFLTNV